MVGRKTQSGEWFGECSSAALPVDEQQMLGKWGRKNCLHRLPRCSRSPSAGSFFLRRKVFKLPSRRAKSQTREGSSRPLMPHWDKELQQQSHAEDRAARYAPYVGRP